MGEIICKCCDKQGLNLQNIQTAHTTQQQQKQMKNLQETLIEVRGTQKVLIINNY